MSSSTLTTSHHGDSANRITPTNSSTPIRDTKVVKKKRAELPQGKLPHPAPKFGDWLNSRTMINNYIILESLGAGSYAEVKLCKEKVTGKLFAMKFINRDIMKKDKLGKQSKLDDIKREIAIMKKLNHPNVLRLYEVMDDPKMNKLFLVLEYMKHGDLLGYQKKKHPHQVDENFNDRDLHSVFLQVILGLAYLHEQKIVHGDIKPQNLLVGDKDIVKIADFGISQSLYGSKQKLNDSVGTPAFMSPEMCSGQEYSGQLADIWAVGATIFMLKYGHPPFLAKSAMEMFERIQSDPLVFPGPLDPSLEDLLRGMLTKNAQKRMTLLQIMTHSWVTKEENPLRQQLLLHEKPQQITVTKEEIENAINVGDRFAIIINIRVQMKKHLKRARQRIMERRASGSNSKSLVTSTKSSIPDQTVKHGNTASRNTNTSKVFIDAASADSKADCCRKMLSDEEIEYRSLLFTRKKPSVAGSPSGTTPTAFSTSTADEKVSITQPATVDGDEEDVFSDDDDDQAVAQSPQLLDELLLTTLSMPPLSKTASTLTPNASNPKSFLSPAESVYNTNKSSGIICGDAQCEEESESLRLQIAVSSLQGRRNTQEDRYTVLPTVDCPESAHWSGSAFVGLYDGHGGEECSTILQEQLHGWLLRSPDDHLATSQRIQKSFTEFDAFICDYLLHKGDLSGSTATCVFFDRVNSDPERQKWRLIIAHVGDCRLVLSRRNGDTVDLTGDHRLTLTEERERILQLGGRVVNNRVNGVMAITRAFGDLEFKGRLGKHSNSSSMTLLPDAVQQNPFQDDERIPPLLTAQPDVEVVDVDGTTDEFLILACDGLWDVMTSDEATSILRDRVHYHGHLQLAAKELAQEGIRRYSNDNITVLVVRFR
ncbi:hypothetical protein Poli38472_011651 [Pythium oligandrum]|uniref:CAMKK/CAMKK-META protein kinase n=1 Tax=Pythium oligandrum TaxID=41045 RepID=A0A8K1FJC6_PYTOL|nr:hypothetical protein Poli38472_011651 [Pythium oligandrum]|eukprot:TMW64771.1 hypothetical protein Poli38472_011651 [Pythium oligandrum]